MLTETLKKLFKALNSIGVQRNGKISPGQLIAPCVGSVFAASVFSLHEEDLLNIFSFLSTSDLLHVSRVCRWWYRLSFDVILWKDVDLKRFASRLSNPEKLEPLILKRFSTRIQCLDLSGFTLSDGTLQILASSCKELRVLKLKSVTFKIDTNRPIQLDDLKGKGFFPEQLEYLDIRFSQGHPRVYRAIASNLGNIQCLGLCDAFFYALHTAGSLEMTIESMVSLRNLDLTHCRLLKDSTVALFTRCNKLEALSLRKCFMLTGSFVQDFLQSCVHLKTLILDGISIDDNTLQSIRWGNSCLTHLELGWCPLITPRGLNSALTRVTDIQSLEYLGLCAVGDGKALDDEILVKLAVSLSKRSSKKLKWLNLNCSRYITKDGLGKLRSIVENVDFTNCPAVKNSILSARVDTKYDENCNVPLSDTAMTRELGEDFSAINFFRFKCSLETPV